MMKTHTMKARLMKNKRFSGGGIDENHKLVESGIDEKNINNNIH